MFGKVDRRSQDSRERPDRPQKQSSSAKQFAGTKPPNHRRWMINVQLQSLKRNWGVVGSTVVVSQHTGRCEESENTRGVECWRKRLNWTELERLYCSSQELHGAWRKINLHGASLTAIICVCYTTLLHDTAKEQVRLDTFITPPDPPEPLTHSNITLLLYPESLKLYRWRCHDTRSCFTGSESQSYCEKRLKSGSSPRSHNLFSNSHLGCCSVAQEKNLAGKYEQDRPVKHHIARMLLVFEAVCGIRWIQPHKLISFQTEGLQQTDCCCIDWFTLQLQCCHRTKVSTLKRTWNPDRSVNFRCNHHSHEAHSKANKTVHLNRAHVTLWWSYQRHWRWIHVV